MGICIKKAKGNPSALKKFQKLRIIYFPNTYS